MKTLYLISLIFALIGSWQLVYFYIKKAEMRKKSVILNRATSIWIFFSILSCIGTAIAYRQTNAETFYPWLFAFLSLICYLRPAIHLYHKTNLSTSLNATALFFLAQTISVAFLVAALAL